MRLTCSVFKTCFKKNNFVSSFVVKGNVFFLVSIIMAQTFLDLFLIILFVFNSVGDGSVNLLHSTQSFLKVNAGVFINKNI